MTTKMKPLKDSEWPKNMGDMLQGFAGRLNVYRVMANHPDLLAAWAPLREHVVRRREMTDQQSEVVILRTGHNLQAPYEWAHHVSRARAVGMDDTRIGALAGPLESIAGDDRILAGAVDELMRNARLSPATLAALKDAIGHDGVLDLMTTVGFYSVLGFIVNSYDVPLDEDIVRQLADRPAPE